MTTRRDLLAAAGALAAGPALAQAPAAPPTVRGVLDGLGQEALDRSPETVTSFGLDKGDRAGAKRELDDRSLIAREDDRTRRRRQLAALEAAARRGEASPDGASLAVALYTWRRNVADDRRFRDGGGPGGPYVLSQLNGAYQSVPDFLDSQHAIATREDADAYLARLGALAAALDQEVEAVRHDASVGLVPPDFALEKALTQLRTLRDQPASQATLVQSLVRRTRAAKLSGEWERPAAAIYEAQVRPALDRQIALLTALRPNAVHDAGVWRLPDGPAFYAASLESQTSTTLTPAQVHRQGLELVAGIGAELDRLFRGQGLSQGAPGARLRALFADPRFLYPNDDAGKARLIADANLKVQAVQARLPQWFGVLPKAPVQIRRVPPAIELGASSNYVNGALDGSRPGSYYINLRDTAELPRWLLPTLCFHEAIPGHHMQISIQQEADPPLFRLMLGNNAYVEGWALYAEQLADEMGLYADDPFGRIGYLHDALLRAVRLVIDTGLHDQRWSRERAVRYFADTLGDPESAAVSEVERYAVWPGQACGYMVGKLDFLRLRERARARQGARFDIRRFHDAVLTSGSMPLAVLDRVVERALA